MIPEHEICVKIGGDKSGGSFKMSFQICNDPHPNCIENTCVFAAFQASDSAVNLHIALDRFKDQVNNLNGTKWRYIINTYKMLYNCEDCPCDLFWCPFLWTFGSKVCALSNLRTLVVVVHNL